MMAQEGLKVIDHGHDSTLSLENLFRRWGLHESLRRHHSRNLGIENLYPWQARCLEEQGVVEGTRNLLYFAPTSGGKTMVAELVLLLRVAGKGANLQVDSSGGAAAPVLPARRTMIVLPFVSMVTEKAKHLQRIVAPYNRGQPKSKRIKVRALYGNKGGGDVRGFHIAVCTIEKANALVNRMAAAEELDKLSCVVLDELHMIGDGCRGQTLELLLTKVLRASTVAAKNATMGPGHRDPKVSLRGSGSTLEARRHLHHVPPTAKQPPLFASIPAGEPVGSRQTGDNVCSQGAPTTETRTQVIGMSATLSNSEELAHWLGAALHVSDFRPVPLDERVLLGMQVYDKEGNILRTFSEAADPEKDPDHVVTLCRESCCAQDQVIIFCSTKHFCHNCALKVARNLNVPASPSVAAGRSALMAKLAKEISVGVDPVLQETIPHGVAFHHAGLTDTERSAIERAFREGTLGVLAATSTLGAGVNLPAGRVILRNLNAPGGGLSATSYRQMAGRAGRKGAGRDRGEAFIVTGNKSEAARASALMSAGLSAVRSALAPERDGGAGLTRLVLEAICGNLVTTEAELAEYMACTLLWHQQSCEEARQRLLDHVWAAKLLLQGEDCVRVELPFQRSIQAAATRSGTIRLSAAGTKLPVTSASSVTRAHSWPHGRLSSLDSGQALRAMPRAATIGPRSTSGKGRLAPERVQAHPVATSAKHLAVTGAITAQGGSKRRVPATLEGSGEPGHRGSEGVETEKTIDLKNSLVEDSATWSHRRTPGGGGASHSGNLENTSSGPEGSCMDAGDFKGNSTDIHASRLAPTKLGLAIFKTSLGPADGLLVYRDLSDAARGVNLRNTLHLAYLLTPLSLPQGLKPNWDWLRSIYSKASASAAENPPGPGAELVQVFSRLGITEAHLHAWGAMGPRGGVIKAPPLLPPEAVEKAAKARKDAEPGTNKTGRSSSSPRGCDGRLAGAASNGRAASNATRLVAAMALTDVSGGTDLAKVARAYGMSKGELQNLRRSAIMFSSMVTSFLKELGWTLFLMLVKGHIPRFSLGVSKHLLPLMQVPGMSRAEADALYQAGVLNAKNLVGATSTVVATALRLNVPFRSHPGGGAQERSAMECVRFERRAHMLRESAREVTAKREKSSRSQTAKLLKAIQDRLPAKVAGAGAALKVITTDLGGTGEHDLIRAAPKVSRKRARFGTNLDLCQRKKSCSGGRSFGGETGLSDDDENTKGGGSDGEAGGVRDDSTDEEEEEEEGDELDMVVAALVSGRAEQDSDESDGDAEEAGMPGVQEGIGGGRQMMSAVQDVSGGIARQPGAGPRLERREHKAFKAGPPCSPSDLRAPQTRPSLPGESRPVLESKADVPLAQPLSPLPPRALDIRDSAAGSSTRLGARQALSDSEDRSISVSTRPEARGREGLEDGASGGDTGNRNLKATALVRRRRALQLSGKKLALKGALTGTALARAAGGQQVNSIVTGGAIGSILDSRDKRLTSPVSGTARTPTTPAGPHVLSAGGESAQRRTPAHAATLSSSRTLRTPTRTPPFAGSPSFLYEAATSQTVIGPVLDESHGGASPKPIDGRVGRPAYEACSRLALPCEISVADGDIFARGPREMAEVSAAWRLSRCFAFVLGGRKMCPVTLAERLPGAAGSRREWSGLAYRRAWEALTSVLPVASYTVESAGESYVPLSRKETRFGMQVVSGIAISLDGKASWYIPLPPFLPPRPCEWWHQWEHLPGEASEGSSAAERVNTGIGASPPQNAGVDDSPACQWRGRSGAEKEPTRRPSSWRALPARAIERVSALVGFPWLCAGWSSEVHHKQHRAATGSRGGDSRIPRRFKCWNQALFLCRRWNALGIKALNRLTAEEPSGRWSLLRDVMENTSTTKVCVGMKSALVCLQGLGVQVRGSLEDPAVATWLADPPLDELAHCAVVNGASVVAISRKRAKTSLAQPQARAPVTSLRIARPAVNFVDLWRMQAAATLSLMAEKECTLQDLSLAMTFHLIEMPAVVAAASMEYCGLSIKPGSLLDMHREVEQRLRDLRGLGDQLVEGSKGDQEHGAGDTTRTNILASSRRVHDMLYRTLGVPPPPSWKKRLGSASTSGVHGGRPDPSESGSRRRASKRAELGPTDTSSLQEMLARSGSYGMQEDPHGFVRAVIQHRALSPASNSLARLLRANRWHTHLGGVRVNPRIELFTSTGRMITSDPPLQNLDHSIRLTRSWRLSLAEEMEADVPELQKLPRMWADESSGDRPTRSEDSMQVLSQGSTDEDPRHAFRALLANSGNPTSMGMGEIVSIVEDRCLSDPIFDKSMSRSASDAARVGARGEEAVPGTGGQTDVRDSMESFWRKRGFPYTPLDAKRTKQVLVRLGSASKGGVYSYPADKVFRVGASFLSCAKAASLASGAAGERNPWFSKKALLKPRNAVVASSGYTFVSADYSQIEMRLMAHLSGDPDLIKVFCGEGDVFRQISAALHGGGKRAEDVTDDERRQAKVIVYGVLYGQSAAALAQNLGERTGTAWRIRETVLSTYPRLKDYMQRVKEECKECGGEKFSYRNRPTVQEARRHMTKQLLHSQRDKRRRSYASHMGAERARYIG